MRSLHTAANPRTSMQQPADSDCDVGHVEILSRLPWGVTKFVHRRNILTALRRFSVSLLGLAALSSPLHPAAECTARVGALADSGVQDPSLKQVRDFILLCNRKEFTTEKCPRIQCDRVRGKREAAGSLRYLMREEYDHPGRSVYEWPPKVTQFIVSATAAMRLRSNAR
jgi:hypothetical protein